MTNPLLDQPAISPPTGSELDDLISRDPLDLSAQDIDKIIALQRQYRARLEAGVKPKRGKAAADGPKVTLDLAALGLVKESPKPVVAPTPGPGFRRRM